MSEQAAPKKLSVGHHTVPRHVLARFANEDGRLTVVRKEPKLKVLRRQSPLNIGVHSHLNNWRDPDGKWHDDLECGPLGNLDNVGHDEIDEVIQFAIRADAESHLRLVRDQTLEKRASLQLFVASLMVRTVGFRERFDDTALPTLLAYMRKQLEDQFAEGKVDQQVYEQLLKIYATPGRVRIQAPEYRHLRLLVPLIEKVATRLHLDTYVSVRRFAEPLLFTGAEPVVVFPTADFVDGRSSGHLFTADDPIEPWQEQEKLLEQVDERMSKIAGIAVALDPHTLMLMTHAETDDGGKLTYIASQVPAMAIAGLTNLLVTASSSWVAGRDDCETLNVLMKASGNGS